MKIAEMRVDEVPIVLRMPMSRLFSITSSTSDATICSAATAMISPMAIDIAIFSMPSAANSDAFRSPQSCARYSGSSASMRSATSGDSSMSVDPHLNQLRAVGADEALGERQRDEPPLRVELLQSERKDAGDAGPPRARLHTRRRQYPLVGDQADRIPDPHHQRIGQLLADQDAVRLAVGGRRDRLDAALLHRRPDVGDVRFERRIDPLQADEGLALFARDERLALNGRAGADHAGDRQHACALRPR